MKIEADSGFVNEYLSHYGDVVRSHLLSYLPAGQPAAYLYDVVAEYPLRPSKMLRSVLCMASCQVHGGTVDDALDCAVTIELLHNAFMVHDDIEDESSMRRGLPTIHATFGQPLAINAGDALVCMSLRPLLDGARSRSWPLTGRMMGEVLDVVLRTIEGQAVELGWMRDGVLDLDDDDYLAMVVKKTCWYTSILPCRLGELAARGHLVGDWHVPFGTFLGSAFQIRDDVLNVDGMFESYGKEIGGDVREGKRTLLLLHLLRTCSPADKKRVQRVYRLPRCARTTEDIQWIMERMHDYGSVQYATSAANGLAGAALVQLDEALSPATESDHSRFLRCLVVELVTRTR
jgi:geranylgeranyl diphosphate synthase type II